jgi:hypothetical protein
MAELLLVASILLRSVFPSIAITWLEVSSCNAVIQLSRHVSNSLVLLAAKIALNRSCEGTPALISRLRARHVGFFRDHAAIFRKSSAPLTTAHSIITTTFTTGYVTSRRRESVNFLQIDLVHLL